MTGILKNKKLLLFSAIFILSVSTVKVSYSEMISPIDAGAIVQHFIQQQRYNAFEKSLDNLDTPLTESSVISIEAKGKIISATDRQALEDVKKSYDNKQYNDVISIANKGLQANPELTDLLLYRGAAYFYSMNFNLALEDAQAYYKVNPQDIDGMLLRSASNLMLRNYDDALNECNSVLKKHDDPRAYEICGLGYIIAKNQNQKAIKYADKALKLDPESSGALLVRSIVFLEEGKFKEALDESNKLLGKGGLKPFGLTVRGFAEFYTHNYANAKEDALKSNEIFNNNPYNYYLLGLIYKENKDKQQSIDAFNKAKELFYNSGEINNVKEVEKEIKKVSRN